MSTTALPEQLSEPAREFARTHAAAADRRRARRRRRRPHVRDARSRDRRGDHDRRPGRGRRRRPSRRGGAASARGRAVAQGRAARPSAAAEPARGARSRATPTSSPSSSRSTTASRSSSPSSSTSTPRSPISATSPAGRSASSARSCRSQQPDMLCYTRKEPVGVCGQIIPWNFPMLMAAWKLAPALAAGLHGRAQAGRADAADRVAARRARARGRASRPASSTSSPGDGETGAALVDHPGVDKVAFTGSTEVGREIGAKAGRALKRVTLELGGKSPNIILPDADLDAAIAGSFQAIYFNTGQACNAGSRLFVHSRPVRRGRRRRSPSAPARRASGPGSTRAPSSARSSPTSSTNACSSYIESGRSEGAELVAGGGTGRPAMAATSSSRRCSRPRATSSGSPARRSSARCWWRCRTSRSRRSPRAPTTPTTDSRPACGRATSARPTGSPRC